MSNFLLIDERLKSMQIIVDSLNADTTYALYNYYVDSIDDLFNKIPNQHFNVIGLITYGDVKIVNDVHLNIPYNIVVTQHHVDITNFAPITNVVISDDFDPIIDGETPAYLEHMQNKTSFNNIVNFWKKVAEKCTPQHIDLLGCAILSNPDWKKALAFLEKEISVNVRSSDDNTGNLKYGGDWILESDNINIKDLYFTSAVDKYPFLLDEEDETNFDSIFHAEMLDASAWWGDAKFTLINSSHATHRVMGEYYNRSAANSEAKAESRIKQCIGLDHKNNHTVHTENGFATLKDSKFDSRMPWTFIYDKRAHDADKCGQNSYNRLWYYPILFAYSNSTKVMHIFVDMGQPRSTNGWVSRSTATSIPNTVIKVATVHDTYIQTPVTWKDHATGHHGNGAWYSKAKGYDLPLTVPNNIETTNNIRGQINVSWTAPASDGGNAITGYKLEQSSNGGTLWGVAPVYGAGSLPPSTVTTTITGLSSSIDYKYRVRAITSKATGPSLSTDIREIPISEYWDLKDTGVSTADAETGRSAIISASGVLDKTLPSTIFTDGTPSKKISTSRRSKLIDLLFKKNNSRLYFKTTKTILNLPVMHAKTNTKVFKKGEDILIASDSDLDNTNGFFSRIKDLGTVNIKPDAAENEYTVTRTDTGSEIRYTISASKAGGKFSVENTNSSTFNTKTKVGYFTDGNVACINGGSIFFGEGVGDATSLNEILGTDAGMTYSQKKFIKSLLIGLDNKLSSLIPTNLFVEGTDTAKRQRRHSLLRMILEMPDNSSKTKIISDKISLNLPDKFLRTEVVVVKPGETLNTETDKGFYSPLENNDTLTIQVGDDSKEYIVTRTDVGDSARYTLSVTSDKVSAVSSSTWEIDAYFQDGDSAKVFNHAVFFGGIGDGGAPDTIITARVLGGGHFLHPESVMNNMFLSGGYGAPQSANRKQETLANKDKTELNQLDTSIRQSAGRPKKRQTQSMGAYQRGYMYKSQAKLEANVGSMDRMSRLKARAVAKSKTHKYDNWD